MTAQRSSRRTSFPSFAGYLVCMRYFRSRGDACRSARLELVTRSLFFFPGMDEEAKGSPTFLGRPLVPSPCSLTPVDSSRQAVATLGCCPTMSRRIGHPRKLISELNDTALALAVYASQRELPHDHARLASRLPAKL